MKVPFFVCVVIVLMGIVSVKAQQKNVEQNNATSIDSTFIHKEPKAIGSDTIQRPSEVVAIAYGRLPRKDISVAIPNAYKEDADDSIPIPNAYKGNDNVAIPNAFRETDTLSSKLIKKQSRPNGTLNGLKLKE